MWYFEKKINKYLGLFFSFCITRQRKLLEIHICCGFSRKRILEICYPTTREQLEISFFLIYMPNVCSAQRKPPSSHVLSEELWTNRKTRGAPECSLLKK